MSAVRRSSGDRERRSPFCSRGGPAGVLGTRISLEAEAATSAVNISTAATHLRSQGQGFEHVHYDRPVTGVLGGETPKGNKISAGA